MITNHTSCLLPFWHSQVREHCITQQSVVRLKPRAFYAFTRFENKASQLITYQFSNMDHYSLNVKENSVSGKFPAYSRPNVIGYYSIGPQRNYSGDLTQLKYIDFPTNRNVKFNLDDGRTLAVKKDDSYDEKIDNILRWMLQNSNSGGWYVSTCLLGNYLVWTSCWCVTYLYKLCTRAELEFLRARVLWIGFHFTLWLLHWLIWIVKIWASFHVYGWKYGLCSFVL